MNLIETVMYFLLNLLKSGVEWL